MQVFEGGNLVSEVGGIQLLATIKNELKFFQGKKLMRIRTTLLCEHRAGSGDWRGIKFSKLLGPNLELF